MKRFMPVGFVLLLAIHVIGKPNQDPDVNVQQPNVVQIDLSSIRANLNLAHLDLREQLETTDSSQERRLLIEQWRRENKTLLDHRYEQKISVSETERSVSALAIPSDASNETRLKLQLINDIQDGRIKLRAYMEHADPTERMQAINAFRIEYTEEIEQLRARSNEPEVSYITAGSKVVGLQIPEGSSGDEKNKLKLRNERINFTREFIDSLRNASPQERRDAIIQFKKQLLKQSSNNP